MHALTIGKLAEAGRVGVETVRYYQRRGLIGTPDCGYGGAVRRYGEPDVKRLRFIRSAQAAGFTLDQIAELLDLDARDDRPRARELARTRIAALDARIAELEAAKASLSKLATACAKGGQGPCPILAAFENREA